MCRGGKFRKLDCLGWNPRVELVGVEWSPYQIKALNAEKMYSNATLGGRLAFSVKLISVNIALSAWLEILLKV
jgi:hypothetical protein